MAPRLKHRLANIGTQGVIALWLVMSASSASAATYPTNPYSTVGGPVPTAYCRNPIDTAGPYQTLDLETVGCLSGSGPNAYPDPMNGLYSNNDGLYLSPGDEEARVEQAIMMATGELVDLMMYKEFQDASASSSGIQIWVENGKKQFTWAFEPWLIAAIQAGTTDIGYLTIKASNSYALYEIPTGVYAGRYSTEGLLTNGGAQAQVSHIRFWKELDYDVVPEPAAVALFGLGSMLLGLRRRRRRNG